MNPIEKYILNCEETHHEKLFEIYHLIQKHVPKETKEDIKWQMPTFVLNGNLVHFAAGKHHIGYYPGASGVSNFEEELKERKLKYSKGAIQFPLKDPLPTDLIIKILKFRIKENQSS